MERDYDDFTGYGQNDGQKLLIYWNILTISKKVNMTVVEKQKNQFMNKTPNRKIFNG